MDEKPVPPHPPSAKQQSWGAFISIIVIVLMILVGAYYASRERTMIHEDSPASETPSQ